MLNYFPAIDIVLFFIRLKLCNKIFESLYGVFVMKKLAITSALLAALAVTGTAHAYQTELNVGYENTD